MEPTITRESKSEADRTAVEGLSALAVLGLLGDSCRLAGQIDSVQTLEELRTFERDWRPYNVERAFNRREGLAVVSRDGNMDNPPQLEPISEFNKQNGTSWSDMDFNTPTPVFHKVTSLHSILKLFPTLGRTNLIRLNSGGFFPPHRDLDWRTFRIIVPIANCDPNHFFFHVGDLRRQFQTGWPYLVNVRQVHSVFSFKDSAIFLLMNVPATKANAAIVSSHLA